MKLRSRRLNNNPAGGFDPRSPRSTRRENFPAGVDALGFQIDRIRYAGIRFQTDRGPARRDVSHEFSKYRIGDLFDLQSCRLVPDRRNNRFGAFGQTREHIIQLENIEIRAPAEIDLRRDRLLLSGGQAVDQFPQFGGRGFDEAPRDRSQDSKAA